MIDAGKPFSQSIAGLILLPAIAAVLALLVVYIVRKLPELLNASKAAVIALAEFRSSIDQRLDSQDHQIASIAHEIHTNNGSSLKDAVIRMEERQKAVVEKLDDHLEFSAYQVQRVDKFIDKGKP